MIDRLTRRLLERRPPDRRAVARQCVRTVHTRGGRRPFNPRGIDVFAADWDNLLLLDACRYDRFAAEADLPGRLERRISRASMTPDWVRANFAGRTLHDVVYVTANGTFSRLREAIGAEIHAEVPVWHDADRTGPDNSISPPAATAEAAREAAERYPDKRLLVHFVQPHTPYLGPTGAQFDPRVPLGDIPRRYDVDDATIERAYRENLRLVLEPVAALLDALVGRTIVSADHGELLGERLRPLPVRDYGHPGGIYQAELVTVPWLVVDDGPRKAVTAEPPAAASPAPAPRDVAAHLRDLGYAD